MSYPQILNSTALQSDMRPFGTTNAAVVSGTLISPQVSGIINFVANNSGAAFPTTYTATAANSGAFAPLGFLYQQVSGNPVKIPFFTP